MKTRTPNLDELGPELYPEREYELETLGHEPIGEIKTSRETRSLRRSG